MRNKNQTGPAVKEEVLSLLQFRILLSLLPAEEVYTVPLPETGWSREEVILAVHSLLRRNLLTEEGDGIGLSGEGSLLLSPLAGADSIYKTLSLAEEERQIFYEAPEGILAFRLTDRGEVLLRKVGKDSLPGEILEACGLEEDALPAGREEENPLAAEEAENLVKAGFPEGTLPPSVWRKERRALGLADRMGPGLAGDRKRAGTRRYVFLQGTYDTYVLVQEGKESRLVRYTEEAAEQVCGREE